MLIFTNIKPTKKQSFVQLILNMLNGESWLTLSVPVLEKRQDLNPGPLDWESTTLPVVPMHAKALVVNKLEVNLAGYF